MFVDVDSPEPLNSLEHKPKRKYLIEHGLLYQVRHQG